MRHTVLAVAWRMDRRETVSGDSYEQREFKNQSWKHVLPTVFPPIGQCFLLLKVPLPSASSNLLREPPGRGCTGTEGRSQLDKNGVGLVCGAQDAS